MFMHSWIIYNSIILIPNYLLFLQFLLKTLYIFLCKTRHLNRNVQTRMLISNSLLFRFLPFPTILLAVCFDEILNNRLYHRTFVWDYNIITAFLPSLTIGFYLIFCLSLKISSYLIVIKISLTQKM